MTRTLKDAMPSELCGGEYLDTPAYKLRDVEVVAEHGRTTGYFKPWPGTHKHVTLWVVLADGHAVGWNENVARGWSFPVIKMKAGDVETLFTFEGHNFKVVTTKKGDRRLYELIASRNRRLYWREVSQQFDRLLKAFDAMPSSQKCVL